MRRPVRVAASLVLVLGLAACSNMGGVKNIGGIKITPPRANPFAGIGINVNRVLPATVRIRAIPADEFFVPTRAEFYDVEYARKVLSAGYGFVAETFLRPVSMAEFTMNGLEGVSRLDTVVSYRLDEDGLKLLDGGRPVLSLDRPSNDDDPVAWANLTVAALEAGRKRSVVLENTETESIFTALFDSAMRQLDPFSRYAGPKQASGGRAQRNGFGGLGLLVRMERQFASILSIVEGTPAFRSGLRADDRIIAVDGKPVAGWSQERLVHELRGPIGSQVRITVDRDGVAQELAFVVIRGEVIPPTVTTTVMNDIAVIQINSFNKGTARSLEATIRELKAVRIRAGRSLQGIVLDLRGNRGGLLTQAIDVADLFVTRGEISTTVGRTRGSDQVFEATERAIAPKTPLVVLINANSASASEVLAAALEDLGRAVLVGTNSYGKGTVQNVYPLPNAAEMTVTWSVLHAPTGYTIHRLGVMPVVCTENAPRDVAAVLAALPDQADSIIKTIDRWRETAAEDTAARSQLRQTCLPNDAMPDFDIELAEALIKNPRLYALALDLGGTKPQARDDVFDAGEDETLMVQADEGLLANDRDLDGDSIRVSAVNGKPANVGRRVTLETGATVIVNGDGSYVFTPEDGGIALAEDETRDIAFTYDITDDSQGSSVALARLVVHGRNDPPVIGALLASTDEDTIITRPAGGLLAGVSDEEGDPLRITAVNGDPQAVGRAIVIGAGGLVRVSSDGAYNFIPTGQYNFIPEGGRKVERFSIRVSDDKGASTDGEVTITILGKNDAPIAVADFAATDESTALHVGPEMGLLANDFDVDGDSVSLVAVMGRRDAVGGSLSLPSGALLTVRRDGSYEYYPVDRFEDLGVGETATDTFTYTVADGQGLTAAGRATVTIRGANREPLVANLVIDTDEDTAIRVMAKDGLLANARDDDGDRLTITAIDGDPRALGRPRTLKSGARLTVLRDGGFVFDPNASFDTLAKGAAGEERFTFTISDDAGGRASATAVFRIAGVNDAPRAIADVYEASDTDVLSVGPEAGVLANDSDPDSAFSVVSVNGFAAGQALRLPSGATITIARDGGFAYDPRTRSQPLSSGGSEREMITYTVADAAGATADATLTVRVVGSNGAPLLAMDEGSVGEDDILAVAAPGLLRNDRDPDRDRLTVVAVNGRAGDVGRSVTLASGALLTVTADGGYRYDPTASQRLQTLRRGEQAVERFSYTATDGQGANVAADVSITIAGRNDAPLVAGERLPADEDAPVMIAAAAGLLANDTDADGDPLVISAVNGRAGNVGAAIALGRGGRLSVSADGALTFDPEGAFDALPAGGERLLPFTYTVSDGAGARETVEAVLVIAGRNDAPLAVDDVLRGRTNQELTLAAGKGLLANDSDPDGDTLRVESVDGRSAAVGASVRLASGALVRVEPDGAVAYDPRNARFEGGGEVSDGFTYTVADSNGGRAQARLRIVLDRRNATPVAENDRLDADEDTVLRAAAGALLANDTDADGDALVVASVNDGAAVDRPLILGSGARLTITRDGGIVYDPRGVEAFEALAPGESARDSFRYAVDDGNGGTARARVTITIQGRNDPPMAGIELLAVREDKVLDVAAGNGLLANDSDPEGDRLSVVAINGVDRNVGRTILLSSGALLSVGADGALRYDPNAAFTRLSEGERDSDGFTYTVSDGVGGFDTAVVTITVTGVTEAISLLP